MEKRTVLAVVLSVIVISGSYLIQGMFFPPATEAPTQTSGQSETVQPVQTAETAPEQRTIPETDKTTNVIKAEEMSESVSEETVVIETELIKVILSNKGGDVVSYYLKDHKDGDEYVDMIFSGTSEKRAFSLAFGGIDTPKIDDTFHVNRISDTVVEFYRDYSVPDNNGESKKFRLSKRYDFKPDEYMFELAVTIDGAYSIPALNFDGSAYTIEFGPQIGPKFEKLTPRYEFRNYYTYANGKRKTEKVQNNSVTEVSSRISWAAIAGKYFTFIAVPDATQYEMAFSSKEVNGVPETSRFFMSRPALNASKSTDIYRFYLGPKTQKALGIYDFSDRNAFKLGDLNLSEVASSNGFLAPLEFILKWFLMIFYHIIPNYGVAIILVTILVKVLMFPLTKKSSESTLRMQTLSPKIKEIQEKYKNNSQKMNVEMAELYKREGYNPLSGCLPMLLQIPIFFAMYNLFNNHFDLRGAMFIPGWIPDLSLPESVWNFAPFKIPILGWSDLRLLPFIYVGSQLLYGKFTQTPDQKGNSQMKMMLYIMPIMFFFILYDVPSGLLLYWIMSNVLTMVQQIGINKYMAKKKAAMLVENEPVIAPKRKKK